MVVLLVFSNAALAAPSPAIPTLPQSEANGSELNALPEGGKIAKEDAHIEQYKATDKVRVIVEVDGDPAITYATKEGKKYSELSESTKENLQNEILKTQQTVKDKLNSASLNIKVEESFTTAFNGFSGEVEYQEITAMKKVPGVKEVTIAVEYQRPEEQEPNMKYSKEIIEAQLAWENYGYDGEGMIVGIIDTGIDPAHKDFVLTDDSKAALSKESVEAAIAENGLPGKFHTAKVPYGYNYMDKNQEVLDLGPGASHHGMHVAGTVAANGDEENGGIKGVSPEAQLLALKVFGNDPNMGSTWGDIYIKAIDDAIILGADVINMSLGSTASFVDENNPEQQAIARAVENGVLMAISAGNSAHLGNGWLNPNGSAKAPFASNPDIGVVGAPGLSYDSLQVASLENNFIDLDALSYEFDGEESGLAPFLSASKVHPNDLETKTYEVLHVGGQGIGVKADFEGIDFTGKFALVKRGNTFTDTALNAQNAGAAGVIVYNHSTGYVNMQTTDEINIPQLFMLQANGEALAAQLAEGVEVNITFTGELTTAPNPTAGEMSDFTSWGLTPNLDFKPEITAPGGNIYSTLQNNEYGVKSGTSMAAPHVAGGAAIVLQRVNEDFDVEGKDRVNLAKNILMNTSTPVVDKGLYNDYFQINSFYSPRRQGAGLMKLDAALSTPVVVTEATTNEAKVALKEIEGNVATFTLNVENLSDAVVTYNVDGTVQTDMALNGNNLIEAQGIFKDGTISAEAPYTGEYPISFSADQLTVPAGESVTFDVTVDLTDTIDWMYNEPLEAIFANGYFVEGFVQLTDVNDSNPTVTVPYVGYKGDWSKPPVIDGMVYDSKSFYGTSGMVADAGDDYNYLGYNPAADTFNNATIAISPNGDGVNDEAIPVLSFLRNAKLVEYKVLDSEGNTLRKIKSEKDVRKHYYDRGLGAYYTLNPENGWDGKVKNTVAADGEYIFEIATTVDFEGKAPQSVKVPVIVDTVAPEVSASVDGYTVNFEATDERSGVSYFDILVDGESVLETPLAADATSYKFDKAVSASSEVTVIAVDYAGNYSEATVGAVDGGNPVITVNTPETFSIHDTSDVKVAGTVTDETEIKEFTVNGQATELVWDEENSVYNFETVVTFEDGANPIEIVAVDEAGNEHSLTNSRMIFVDTTAPELSVDVPTRVSGETETVELTTHISDNAEELRFLIDGSEEFYNEMAGYNMVPFSTEVTTELTLEPGENVFELKLVDLAGNTTTEEIVIHRTDGGEIFRLEGENRYETSVAISQAGFESSDVVVLARGDNFADALAGVPLAAKYDAPVLLTRTNKLEDVTKEEIARLGATKVYILGGYEAIGSEVDAQVKSIDSKIEVVRLAGESRYDTAAKIAHEVAPEGSDAVVVVNGKNFPDALSVASYAGANNLPILLTATNELPERTSDTISELGATEALVIGGVEAVSESVESDLPNPERIAGNTRYETSVAVAEYFEPNVELGMFVATGKQFADALSGAALAAAVDSGILLVGNDLDPSVENYLVDNNVANVAVLGGKYAVSDSIYNKLKDLLQ